MISKSVLMKLAAVSVVGSVSVGYIAYNARLGNLEAKDNEYDKMIENMSMFSTSYISSGGGLHGGYGRPKKEGPEESDSVSLTGSGGSYDHSRVGKEFIYD